MHHLVTLVVNNPFICSILVPLLICISIALLIILMLNPKKPSKQVFIVDFSCYKPKKTQTMTKKIMLQKYKLYHNMSQENSLFVQKMLDKSGIGDRNYFPNSLMRDPPNPCLDEARKEAEEVMFEAVDQVLEKTASVVQCKEDIGIVVVNCSLFSTVPCLADMIVSKYKLRDDVVCYNLVGMGCSAGLSAIGLAKQLLQVHHDTYALVISTENITQNCYDGNSLSMIVANCLFRVGGAAILLSNRPSDRHTSKYQLIHTVHTHTARSDLSYKCIHQQEDEDGVVGVTITKDLMVVAIKAIEANIMVLGTLVLPVSEQLRFLTTYIIRYYLHVAKIKAYVPNFKNAFDHFLPHVGGKPVLDDVQKCLGFSDKQMEASRMTLYRFGNTSSSSIWYGLAYAEAKGSIRKGDRVWQIAFGAGFKCNSAVLRAMKTVGFDDKNPWSEDIDEFPVDVSNIGPFPYYLEPSKGK